MKKTTAIIAVMVLVVMGAVIVGHQHRADAGPLDDLMKVKDTVDKYKDPAKDLVDAMKPWPYPEERSSGRVLAAKVANAFGGIYKDDSWNNYVNLVGRGLVPYCNRPDIKYRFAVLNHDSINAYSCPGGYIFVTKGLLKKLDSEDQFAGVLGHEIAHVSQRHIEMEMKKQKSMGALFKAGLTYAESSGELTSEQAEMAAQLGEASWDVLISKGLNRKDEFEADSVGTDNIVKMGYNPNGVLKVLEKLKAMEGGKSNDLKVITKTHPKASKRMDKLTKHINNKGYDTKRKVRDKRFENFKAKHPLR